MISRSLAAALALAATLFTAAGRPAAAQSSGTPFYSRGAVYFDWQGSRYTDGMLYNQVSLRVKFDLIARPGQGWTLTLDARDRLGLAGSARNDAIVYNARLTYDKAGSPFTLMLGQMNLYDTAGIGSLLGGAAALKVVRGFSVGGYGGLQSSPYISRLDAKYLKAGAFVRWLGPKGRTVSLGYNQLFYGGQIERRFLYANAFTGIDKVFSFYGDAEYELGGHVAGENRLSRLFGTARVDLGRWADLSASFSQGKGLDFHRYLLEASQDPSLFDQNIERYYYSNYASVRLSLKPTSRLRLSVSRQRSEQKDQGVLNHTWRFTASAVNLLARGLSFTGDYAMNRGDLSESDSYRISATKDFGRFSLTGGYSSTYNGLRYDPNGGDPQILHLADARNVSLGTLVRIGRGLTASIEYGGFLQSGLSEHFLFVRLIYRTR